MKAQIIRPLYIAEVERKYQPDENRVSSGLYNAGDIGKCPRAAYYNRCVKHGVLDYTPPPLPTQWKFSQGLIVEKIMVDGLLAKYPEGKPQTRWTSEAYQMAGVIDWYDPAVMMAECKGMMGTAWNKQKADVKAGKPPFKPHFIAQLGSYKWLSGLEAPEARLFCTAYEVFPLMDEYILEDDAVYQLLPGKELVIVNPPDKGTCGGMIIPEAEYRTPVRWYKNPWTRERLIHRAEDMVMWWDNKALPPDDTKRDDDMKWLCGYCEHAQICAANYNPLTQGETN